MKTFVSCVLVLLSWNIVVEAATTDGRKDIEEIPCGFPPLGAEIEVLVEPDVMSNALRVTPVRPLRSGASSAAQLVP